MSNIIPGRAATQPWTFYPGRTYSRHEPHAFGKPEGMGDLSVITSVEPVGAEVIS